MEKNEIKKMLYRDNPLAHLAGVRKDGIHYILDCEEQKLMLSFLVPLSEIGETIWGKQMEAKLLIRYLQ